MSNRNSLTWKPFGHRLERESGTSDVEANSRNYFWREMNFGRYTNKKESNRTVGREWFLSFFIFYAPEV